jgi:hypothetical protein
MGHDSLTAKAVRKYIGRAGGTTKVAKRLAVPVEDVVRWARDGLDDEDQAIRLMDLGQYRVCRYGLPPRCRILLPGELDRLIGKLGGLKQTAEWLKVSLRTLRRYRSGSSNMPELSAERVRKALDQRLASGASASSIHSSGDVP